MKTAGLIDTLVADNGSRPATPRRTLWMAMPAAIAIAIVLFSIILDMRPDFLEALATWRYLLKLALSAGIAMSGLALVFRFARPGHTAGADFRIWLLALLPLLAGVAAEAALLPREAWGTSTMGVLPAACLVCVPVLSLAPLAAFLAALRSGAPDSPAAAGAVAGVAAGGLGALIYAVHCNNDSPFFVGTWYMLAIAIVALFGAALGRTVLRW